MAKAILVAAMVLSVPLASFAQQNDNFLDAVLLDRVKKCENHFDIKPYISIAIGDYNSVQNHENIAQSVENFIKRGKLILPQNKSRNPIALSCANYAEGIMTGSFLVQLVGKLPEAIGQSLSQGLADYFNKNGEANNQGPNQGK